MSHDFPEMDLTRNDVIFIVSVLALAALGLWKAYELVFYVAKNIIMLLKVC